MATGDNPDFFGFNPDGMANMAFMKELKQFLTSDDASVKWDVAREVAQGIAGEARTAIGKDEETQRWADAIRVAEMWLDPHTSLAPVLGPTLVLSAQEWVERAAGENGIARYVEPVATGTQDAMAAALTADIPALAGQIDATRRALRPVSALLTAIQIGTAAGHMGNHLIGGYDLGMPTVAPDSVVLVGNTLATIAAEHEIPETEMRFWLALREAVHRRVFAGATWLLDHLSGEFAAYAQAIEFDAEDLTSAFDPSLFSPDLMNDPEALHELAQNSALEIAPSAEQAEIQRRIRTLLVLVAGYADELTARASEGRLTSLARIEEVVMRRRAENESVTRFLHQLVGLELRPRDVAEGRMFVAAVLAARGPNGLDVVWRDSAHLPSAAELGEPERWLLRLAAEETELGITAEFQDGELAIEIPDDLSGLEDSGESPTEDDSEE